jgi:TrmH family RNA methyltransferase
MSILTSKDNPKVQHWRKLAEDARYRRAEKRALIEGPHLLEAALQHGCKLLSVLATPEAKVDAGLKPILVSEGVFRSIVDAETPQGVAAEIAIPERKPGSAVRVFLEGVQDPRNVGAIIRTAAAFGVGRAVLDKACADPWSPKALRAGMGGHFAISIKVKSDLSEQLNAFKGHLLCTVPRDGMPIEEADLSGKIGWIFGGEGRGLSEETLRQVPLRVTIPMASGTESLNVAAAAAICLFETFRRNSGTEP